MPVTSGFCYAIYDSVAVAHECVDVAKQLPSTLEFQLTYVRGNVGPLHGLSLIHISEPTRLALI
eukprot:432172-Alexandrium_andersonii.AAC.1